MSYVFVVLVAVAGEVVVKVTVPRCVVELETARVAVPDRAEEGRCVAMEVEFHATAEEDSDVMVGDAEEGVL